MARIYKKKADAKNVKLTIPVSDNLFDRLKRRAECRDRPFTAVAREFIMVGLDTEEKIKEHERG